MLHRHILLAIICLAPGHATLAADSHQGESPFAQVVLREFDTWDKEHQGRLTFPMIEQWTRNPSLRGEAAAAMAELHNFMRREVAAAADQHKSHVSEFTRAYFERYNRMTPKERRAQHNFDHGFQSCKKKLATESRELFPEGMPKRSAMRQGHLGDCHFLGPLGSMVSKRPGDVKRMIEGNQKHGYTVHFPKRPPIKISPLTDTELGLFSSAGNNGIWLAVLEKACGELHRRACHMKTRDDFDALAQGPAHTRTDVSLLTGHRPDRLTIPDPARNPRQFKESEHKIRETLSHMSHSKHVCAASSRNSDKAKPPPGMAGSHSYALIGFDSSKDVVHLWNPWGHQFSPKGSEGLSSGYKTDHGVFEMPLKDFAHEFSVVSCESNQPVEHAPK